MQYSYEKRLFRILSLRQGKGRNKWRGWNGAKRKEKVLKTSFYTAFIQRDTVVLGGASCAALKLTKEKVINV